jgi:hypothetical protein
VDSQTSIARGRRKPSTKQPMDIRTVEHELHMKPFYTVHEPPQCHHTKSHTKFNPKTAKIQVHCWYLQDAKPIITHTPLTLDNPVSEDKKRPYTSKSHPPKKRNGSHSKLHKDIPRHRIEKQKRHYASMVMRLAHYATCCGSHL